MYCPFTGLIQTRNETLFRQDIPAKDAVIYFPLRLDIGEKISFRSGSTFEVVAVDQQRIPMIKYPFVYQSYYHPTIRLLKDRLNMEARLDGTSGYERISRLYRFSRFEALDDIAQQWGWPAFWELIGFGLPGHDTAGACAETSHRFVCLAAACGLIARKVNFGQNNPQTSLPHVCTEVWSDDYQKWIFWDAMIPYYFEDVGTGLPLNMEEVLDRNLAGQFDSVRIRTWRKPDGQMSHELLTVEYKDRVGSCVEDRWPDRFFWCVIYMGNNHLDMPFNRFPYSVVMLMKPPLDEDLWREQGNACRYYVHKSFLKVWDVHNVYFPQHQTEIHLADTPHGPVLALAHYTPNFHHLEVRMNNGPWRPVDALSPLSLSEQMTLEARTVNAAGLSGKPAQVVLRRV